jgi:3-oxoacyl-[acyl-carrier-protein] synthase II
VPAARVAVTGMGAVSGFGAGVAALAAGLRRGETAIRPFALFDATRHRTRLAAQVPDDVPLPRGATWSRCDGFGLLAAAEAVAAARLRPPDLRAAGVFVGTSTAGMHEAAAVHRALRARAPRVRARPVVTAQNGAPAEAVARAWAVGGPVHTLSSACVSGAAALQAALAAVRSGEVPLALAGGADALCELTYAGFNALRAVDERPCRPFRADRAGMSLGEGAAVLVLEPVDRARARGATVLAEFAGAGSSCDAHHMSAPEPSGEGAARAIRAALADAGLLPQDVDFVNAHGTGTPLNDAAETAALAAVFGERQARLPLCATKALVGHLLGSAGAIEAVATVLALGAREVQPVPAAGPRDPALAVDLVEREPRRLARARVALSLNLAFGGTNAALVFVAAGAGDG